MDGKKIVLQIDGKQHELKCNQCIKHLLPAQYIDIQWDKQHAIMTIAKSSTNIFQYQLSGLKEQYKGVLFQHGHKCPYLNQSIIKNHDRFIKPCCCVMLIDNHEILVTRRNKDISFGGAWVLPGGHLEKHEGILEGGLRECHEQVAYPQEESTQPIRQMMAWQSVYVLDGKIKSSGLVLLLVYGCKKFPVKVQEEEVMDYRWKNINDQQDEHPYDHNNGYAEGHLTFIKYVRQTMFQ